MKQPEFKVYLQFLYKHEILKAIQDYYESNSWTITDNNKIVNTLTGEVLPFLIRIKNGTITNLEKLFINNRNNFNERIKKYEPLLFIGKNCKNGNYI